MSKDVLLVLTSGFPRWQEEGLNTFMYDYCRFLSRHYKVIVVAPRDKNSAAFEKWGDLEIHRHKQSFFFENGMAYGNGMLPNIKKNPLLLFSFPAYLFYQYRLLKKLVWSNNVKIVNCHWIIPQGITVRLFQLLNNKPFISVGTVHGSDYWKMSRWPFSSFLNFSLRHLDLVLAVSETLQAAISEKYPQLNTRFQAIGIDTEKFKPIEKAQHSKTFRLLFVGNVVREKGIEDLVHAISIARKKIPGLFLTVVGEGVLRPELIQFIKAEGLATCIEFCGPIPNKDLPAYYSQSDLFCLPSYSEGYPIVLKEAMSCGLPCLVSDLPVYMNNKQLKDILYFFHTADVDGLAKMIISIQADLPNNEKAKKGRNYMLETADWVVLTKSLVHEINQIKK